MKIKHLEELGMSYFEHLFHAWKMSIILFVHGVIPTVWEHKVSNEIIDHNEKLEYEKKELRKILGQRYGE